MGRWSEVTDPSEIAGLYRQLTRRLAEGTHKGGVQKIGYPAGSFEAQVRLASMSARKNIWVYSGQHEESGHYITLVGRHAPGQRGPLLIDLQFNYPSRRFNRQMGGAFVKDRDGRAFLAHRGIVTRGTARVRKAEVFRLLRWRRPVIAESDIKPYKTQLVVVAALDDARLVPKILKFSGEMRDAATLAADQIRVPERDAERPKEKRATRDGGSSLDLKLSEYRDEFSGTRTVDRKDRVIVDWKHGRVVSALRRALEDRRGELKVCKAADLVLIRAGRVDLFEVKPSSSSQSIYTAIGQLVFNGSYFERTIQTATVRKFLVLPWSSKQRARQQRCRELGFHLVTFRSEGAEYRFSGLPG